MNYRSVKIHAAEVLGTTGTKLIPIRIQDPITRILLKGTVTFGAAPRIAPTVDALTKVEIVDGSDVLFELSGSEMVAHRFYEGHKQVLSPESNIPDAAWGYVVEMLFGRYIFDPLLAFDPKQFSNPMLRVTWNALAPNVNATAFSLEVDAECFDEKQPSPLGFLRTTEYHSIAGADSAYHYVELPVDLPIRKLYLQCKNYGEPLGYNLAAVKLQEDNDKRVVFDMDADKWVDLMSDWFGYLLQNFWAYGTGWADGAVFVAPSEAMMATAANTAAYGHYMINRTRGSAISVQSADETDLFEGMVTGCVPHQVFCYPMGIQKDIEDWYNLENVKSLRLRVLAGTDGDDVTFNTILQQLRRY